MDEHHAPPTKTTQQQYAAAVALLSPDTWVHSRDVCSQLTPPIEGDRSTTWMTEMHKLHYRFVEREKQRCKRYRRSWRYRLREHPLRAGAPMPEKERGDRDHSLPRSERPAPVVPTSAAPVAPAPAQSNDDLGAAFEDIASRSSDALVALQALDEKLARVLNGVSAIWRLLNRIERRSLGGADGTAAQSPQKDLWDER